MENVYYYYGLYFVVLIVKIAKHVKTYESLELREKWTEVLEVSLDLTFAASGCVIALLINVDKSWIPVVYILSTLILLISAFMEFLSDRLKKIRPYINSVIILTIFVCTYLLFNKVIPKVDNTGHLIIADKEIPDSLKIKTYVVVIPYKDETLIRNHGYGNMGEKQFLYKVEISDSMMVNAKVKAIEYFKNDETIQPVLKTRTKESRDMLIKIQESEILIFPKELK